MSVWSGIIALKRRWPSGLRHGKTVNLRMFLIGLLGVALLLASNFFDSEQRPKTENQIETVKTAPEVNRSYEEALEVKLANVLSKVKGAGTVAVCITLENGAQQEYAKNSVKESRVIQEKDNGGGIRTTTENKENEQILLSRENGAERPVTVKEYRPRISGVLVVAEGAQDSVVKISLTKAVESCLGIPSYKITVLPQKR